MENTDPVVAASRRARRRRWEAVAATLRQQKAYWKQRKNSVSKMRNPHFTCHDTGFSTSILDAEHKYKEKEFQSIREGILFEPFNLEKERRKGYFDEDGFYISFKCPKKMKKDAWIEQLSADGAAGDHFGKVKVAASTSFTPACSKGADTFDLGYVSKSGTAAASSETFTLESSEKLPETFDSGDVKDSECGTAAACSEMSTLEASDILPENFDSDVYDSESGTAATLCPLKLKHFESEACSSFGTAAASSEMSTSQSAEILSETFVSGDVSDSESGTAATLCPLEQKQVESEACSSFGSAKPSVAS